MENSQLVKIFRTLSTKEQRDFHEFLQTPLFNKNEKVLDLLMYLLEWRKGKHKSLEKERVHQVLFPNEKYDDQQLRHLMSYLNKQLAHFLAYQEFIADKISAKLYLARAFRKRNLEQAFLKNLKQTDAALEKQSYRNIIYLENKFDIELERYANLERKGRTEKKNLQEVADVLDKAFLAGRLRMACLQVSQQDVAQQEYDWGILEDVLHYIATHSELLDTPAIAIYYYYYMARKGEEKAEQYFEALQAVILQHGAKFPATDIRDIYLLVLNYYASKTNTGDLKYIRNSLDLYQFALKQGFLLSEGYLSRFTYKNVVTLATRLGEFTWAMSFIESYKNNLAKYHQEPYYLYNLAKYHQEQGNYQKAMPYLQQLDSKDSMLMLGAKMMQVKMCYELKEWQALTAIIESTKMYLFRRKTEMSAENRTPFHHFFRLTQKLAQVNIEVKIELLQLKKEIEETSPLAERTWLLTQVRFFNV